MLLAGVSKAISQVVQMGGLLPSATFIDGSNRYNMESAPFQKQGYAAILLRDRFLLCARQSASRMTISACQ